MDWKNIMPNSVSNSPDFLRVINNKWI